MPGGWYLEHGEKDPTLKIIVGVIAVGAIALGVVLATRGDDGDGARGTQQPSTTVVTSAGGATTAPIASSTTSPGTSAPTGSTATPGVIQSATLVAAMPTAAETPAGWERWREPQADPSDDDGASFCEQATEIQRGREHGLQAVAWGPAYDLPQGGWFAFDVFTFDDAAGATQFLQSIADDANQCSDRAFTYTEREADVDFMAESWGDFVWSVEEASAASELSVAGQEALLRATVQMRYSATVDATQLTVNETVLIVFEQRGRTVVEYWVGGNWSFTGLDPSLGQPDWAYQPVQADLDGAVDTIREPMQTRLESAGAI